MRFIDLNCDMGESFGPWQMGRDSELVKYASSNKYRLRISRRRRVHDPQNHRARYRERCRHRSAPELSRPAGFRPAKYASPRSEIFDIVVYQIAAVKGICESLGTRLHHVKPHGALYNQAAKDPVIARQIAKAIRSIDEALIFYGLSGSHLISEGENRRAPNRVRSIRRPDIQKRRQPDAAKPGKCTDR